MSASCLSLHDLHCERDERVLFSGLNADFSAGSVVQVAGPNGAGKTTLLKILTGLAGGYEGKVRWRGKDVGDWNRFELYSCLLYLGHLPGVKSSLTAWENLSWYFGLNGIKNETTAGGANDLDALLNRALEQVGLAGYEDVLCSQMSAGQQRRVGLARLYCSKAPLWILDEPFTAIDRRGVASIEQLIQNHAEAGGLVVLTTHQPLGIGGTVVLDLADFKGQDA